MRTDIPAQAASDHSGWNTAMKPTKTMPSTTKAIPNRDAHINAGKMLIRIPHIATRIPSKKAQIEKLGNPEWEYRPIACWVSSV